MYLSEHEPRRVRPSGSPWAERINPYENSTVDDLARFPEEVLDPAASPFSEEVSQFENSVLEGLGIVPPSWGPKGPAFLMPFRGPFWVEFSGPRTDHKKRMAGPFASYVEAANYGERQGALQAGGGYYAVVDQTGTEVPFEEGPGL